jgi:hypothetical protein
VGRNSSKVMLPDIMPAHTMDMAWHLRKGGVWLLRLEAKFFFLLNFSFFSLFSYFLFCVPPSPPSGTDGYLLLTAVGKFQRVDRRAVIIEGSLAKPKPSAGEAL